MESAFRVEFEKEKIKIVTFCDRLKGICEQLSDDIYDKRIEEIESGFKQINKELQLYKESVYKSQEEKLCLNAPLSKQEFFIRAFNQVFYYFMKVQFFLKKKTNIRELIEKEDEVISYNDLEENLASLKYVDTVLEAIIEERENSAFYYFLVTRWNDFFTDDEIDECNECLFICTVFTEINYLTSKKYGSEIQKISILYPNQVVVEDFLTNPHSLRGLRKVLEHGKYKKEPDDEDLKKMIRETLREVVNEVYSIPRGKEISLRGSTLYDSKIIINNKYTQLENTYKGSNPRFLKILIHEFVHAFRMKYVSEGNYLDSTGDSKYDIPVGEEIADSGAIFEKEVFGSYLDVDLLTSKMLMIIFNKINWEKSKDEFHSLCRENLTNAFSKYKGNIGRVLDCNKLGRKFKKKQENKEEKKEEEKENEIYNKIDIIK